MCGLFTKDFMEEARVQQLFQESACGTRNMQKRMTNRFQCLTYCMPRAKQTQCSPLAAQSIKLCFRASGCGTALHKRDRCMFSEQNLCNRLQDEVPNAKQEQHDGFLRLLNESEALVKPEAREPIAACALARALHSHATPRSEAEHAPHFAHACSSCYI